MSVQLDMANRINELLAGRREALRKLAAAESELAARREFEKEALALIEYYAAHESWEFINQYDQTGIRHEDRDSKTPFIRIGGKRARQFLTKHQEKNNGS